MRLRARRSSLSALIKQSSRLALPRARALTSTNAAVSTQLDFQVGCLFVGHLRHFGQAAPVRGERIGKGNKAANPVPLHPFEDWSWPLISRWRLPPTGARDPHELKRRSKPRSPGCKHDCYLPSYCVLQPSCAPPAAHFRWGPGQVLVQMLGTTKTLTALGAWAWRVN